jgi:branched-chain amino acid transport system permease protein
VAKKESTIQEAQQPGSKYNPLNKLNKIVDKLYELFDKPVIRYSVIAFIVAIAIYLPQISNMHVQGVLTTAFFFMVVCLGLNIIVGFAGLLTLGYAAFVAIGAYTTGILILNFGMSFWLTLPLSALAAVIAGLIIGVPTLRLRSDYLAIVTLGFGEIVRLTARNLEITGGAVGLVGIDRPTLFGITLYQVTHFYYMFFIVAVIAIIVSYRLYNSRLGRSWQYIREDEDAAAAMGINVVAARLYAFIIGSVFGAIAGSFMAVRFTAVAPESFVFMQSVMFLMAVIIGGMGKIPGVVLGALIVTILPELFRGIGEYRMLIFAVFLLFIMLYRPQGIWPDRRT